MLGSAVEIDDVAGAVGRDNGIAGRFGEIVKSFFTCVQRILRLLTCGDVGSSNKARVPAAEQEWVRGNLGVNQSAVSCDAS